MNRRKSFILALMLPGAACFAPDASVQSATTSAGSTGSTGLAGGTGSTTSPGSGTSEATTEAQSSTVDPDATVSSGGSAGECGDQTDCDDGLLCIGQVCAPCSDVEDGDAECAAALPERPICGDDGRCVACTQESCSGETPICEPALGCVACTEHPQCPESACHLGGPDVGTCFDVEDVVEVQAPGGFGDLLEQVAPGEDRVFILGAGTYTFPVPSEAEPFDVDGQREVAVLGNGSTVVEGSVGANAAFFLPEEDASQLYLSRVEWIGVPAGSPSFFPLLAVGEGAELWVDDSTTRGTLFLTGGEAHLRRSNVFEGVATPYGFNDSSIQGEGALFLENTSVEPALEHIRIGGEVDIRYSTVVIDGDLICGSPLGGVVRNSIVLTGGVIDKPCEGASWSGNAVNTAGFGTSVPSYTPMWFGATAGVRFRLSKAGAEVFGEIAEWAEGDPLLDAQGDERPTMGPSAAGVDEP